MENLIRLLMRFLLVPLGYFAASIAGTLVVLIGWWQFAEATIGTRPDNHDFAVLGLVIAGPILLMVMLANLFLPASVGILISEAFAIRSWIFHVLNGIVATWVGWQFFGSATGTGMPLEQPLVVVAAGIAAGFAYWAVAGFSAGFYKPIFKDNPPPSVPATTR
jgi:hypothetical protein